MIEVQGLTKYYGSKRAVHDLSFQVLPGRVTGFLGPNGAGKSTTMRLILGLDTPTSGSALVGGTRYRGLPVPLHEVGALLEARSLHPGRSAYNHLLSLAQTHGLDGRRVDEVLELVGLSHVARKRAGGFSLGMGQRLGVAAALIGDPNVVMLDEPVNGLDPEGVLWVRHLLKQLAGEGRTVFVSSHLMSEMAVTADHLIVIGRGELIADTSVEDFVSQASQSNATVLVRTRHAEAFGESLRRAGASVTARSPDVLEVSALSSAQVGQLAADHGIVLHELIQQRVSLEDAFMQLTRGAVEYGSSVTQSGTPQPGIPQSGTPQSGTPQSGTSEGASA